ncbi:hypothetical protein [Hansschlegelia sp. KR7-227]|uniref:hypothetical protein n=1 Tax=Hansschlegelia sp. KR7-227 TaxID=3400914 RepID=UPI003C08E2DC
MAFSLTRSLVLAVTVAATPFLALPAAAQSERAGVSVTIRKAPSYLNTRTTPSPGSATRAARETSALTQSSFPVRNSNTFSRWPLPTTFDTPGY